jgi:hypothetical protein
LIDEQKMLSKTNALIVTKIIRIDEQELPIKLNEEY